MKRRKLSLVTTLLALACLTTACGTPSGESSSPAKDTEEIVVSTWAGDPFESAWKEKAKEFEEQTGISVVIDAVPWENLREKTVLELVSGTGAYDVLYVHPSWFDEFVNAGYLMPASEYASEEELDAFVPNLLADYSRDGEVYGLPDFVGSQVLAYRTDIFEEYQLDVPDSWSDILTACEALAGNPEFAPITFPGKKGGTLASLYGAFLVSNGGWYLNDQGEPAMDTPEALEAIVMLQKLAQYQLPGYLNVHWDENGQIAANGKAAMAIIMSVNAAWLEDAESSATAGKWAYIPLYSDKGTPGGIVDNYCWSVVEGSEHAQAAGDFVKFITGTECQTYFTETSSTCGATQAYYENKALIDAQPVLGALQKTLTNTKPAPTWSSWNADKEVLEVQLQGVMSGSLAPEEAAEAIQAQMLTSFSK